jgi:hypothetical protein
MSEESKTKHHRKKINLTDRYQRIGIKAVAAAVRRQKKSNTDQFSKSQKRKMIGLNRPT